MKSCALLANDIVADLWSGLCQPRSKEVGIAHPTFVLKAVFANAARGTWTYHAVVVVVVGSVPIQTMFVGYGLFPVELMI